MSYPRQSFTAGKNPLMFSMALPPGLMPDDLPGGHYDFSNRTVSEPLAMIVSPNAEGVLLAVAARPAYDDGQSVADWCRFLAGHFKFTIDKLAPGVVGGPNREHPAILIEAHQEQDGQRLRLDIAAFEDGGQFITLHARCPLDIWEDYGPFLRDVMLSFELDNPQGPTVPLTPGGETPAHRERSPEETEALTRDPYKQHLAELEEKRAPALAEAAALLEAQRYDDAERAVRIADDSIYGAVAIAGMYREHLRSLVSAGQHKSHKPRVEEVFRRALNWAGNTYPEPHTREEADSYERGRAEDLAELVKILGYNPME